jgi:hypothetical protein
MAEWFIHIIQIQRRERDGKTTGGRKRKPRMEEKRK